MEGFARGLAVLVIASTFAAAVRADTQIFIPIKDTEIPSSATGTACGSIPPQLGQASAVRVGRDAGDKATVLHRSLFHFDLAIIPTNSVIQSAILEFNVAQFTATAAFDVEIRRMTQPAWKESETNWTAVDCDTDPGRALQWCTSGGDFTTVDGVTWTATGTGNRSVDIRPLVEKAVGQAGTKAPTSGQLHFIMKAAGDTSGGKRFVLVRSKEYAAFRPRLTVTWTPPPSSPSPWVSFRDETAQRLATSSCTEQSPTDPLSDNDRMEKDIAIGDFDRDGDKDVIVVRRVPFVDNDSEYNQTFRQPILLLNEGGVLTERPDKFPTMVTSARDIVLGDFDGQNGPDMAIATTCGDPPKFVRNRGGFGAAWLGFEDYTANWKPTNGPYCGYTAQTSRYCGVDAGDVDEDGDLDIYMVNYLGRCFDEPEETYHLPSDTDILLINRISTLGRFVDETPARLGGNAAVEGFGTSAAIADVNGDGIVDLVKNDADAGTGTRIFPGSGSPDYAFSGIPILVENSNEDGYHVTVGDLNADGSPDLYVAADAADRYYFGPFAAHNPPHQSVTGSGNRTGSVGGNAKFADLDGDLDADVGVADVDLEFTSSCNLCLGSVGNCSQRCAASPCAPAPTPAPVSCQTTYDCVEENLNTKTCLATGLCSDSFRPELPCSEDSDCQKRLFTLLRNTNGVLEEPWSSDSSQNFHLRTYDFDFLDINGDGCMDLFMGVCSGYKVFVRNCP